MMNIFLNIKWKDKVVSASLSCILAKPISFEAEQQEQQFLI